MVIKVVCDIALIPGDPIHVLDDPCGLRVYRIAQLTAAMHPAAQQIAAVMSSSAVGLTSDPGNLALSVPDITDNGSLVRNPSFVQRQSDSDFL